MNAPRVKHSLILAFAGIPQRNPLSPNGRVFRKLAGRVPAFMLNEDDSVSELTYEEAFFIRFTRWLSEPLLQEFDGILDRGQCTEDRLEKIKAFAPKLDAHKAACPPPWAQEGQT